MSVRNCLYGNYRQQRRADKASRPDDFEKSRKTYPVLKMVCGIGGKKVFIIPFCFRNTIVMAHCIIAALLRSVSEQSMRSTFPLSS